MEEWTPLLVVVIGIMFSFFKTKFNDTNEADYDLDDKPSDYNFEEVEMQEVPKPAPAATPPPKPRPFIQQPTTHNKNTNNYTRPITPSAKQMVTEEKANEEFQINSAEEARKAIIWGEILQRKHF